jgi:hypothetical protein
MAGHVARIVEKRKTYRRESQKERDKLEDQDVGGWMLER